MEYMRSSEHQHVGKNNKTPNRQQKTSKRRVQKPPPGLTTTPTNQTPKPVDAVGESPLATAQANLAANVVQANLAANDIQQALAVLGGLDEPTFAKVIQDLAARSLVQALLNASGVPDDVNQKANSANSQKEVTIPTTLLEPAKNTIKDDFKRANQIYNAHGIEIEQGTHLTIKEEKTKKLLGSDLELDEFTSDKATKEEQALVELNRNKGRISGYWVPDMPDSRGEALIKKSLNNLKEDRTSVVVNTKARAQDTFAHEVGHVLGLSHDASAKNLMASGTIRDVSGKAGTDKLSDEQLKIIRKSAFIEYGKKGIGK